MRRIAPPKAKPKYLALQKGEYSKPAVWEPMGRSPGNTPQAMIQFAQTLMPFLLNPILAQTYGIDGHELLKVIINAGPLANAKNILKTKEDMQDEQQSAAAGMVPPGQPGPPPGIHGQPGGAPPTLPAPPGPPGVPVPIGGNGPQ